MRIIANKSDNTAVYMFDDSTQIQIDAIMTLPFVALDISADTHIVISDVPPPDMFVGGAMAWLNGEWVITDTDAISDAIDRQHLLLDGQKNKFCSDIDRAADAARLLIVGDPVRVVEYQRAEAEATAYAAAGYTGTVPPSVLSWSEAKQWTAQTATDDIIRAAVAWNSALYALRDIRLKGKEAVKAAETAAAAQTAAATAEAQIKVVLDQVPQ